MSENQETVTEQPVSADLLERIEATINRIRPYIRQDGGDIQLVDYKDGVHRADARCMCGMLYGKCRHLRRCAGNSD